MKKVAKKRATMTRNKIVKTKKVTKEVDEDENHK